MSTLGARREARNIAQSPPGRPPAPAGRFLLLSAALIPGLACGKDAKPQEASPFAQPEQAKPRRGGSQEACAIPDTAKLPPETRYSIPSGCKLRVEKDWVIDNDARITLRDGVTLSFAKGAGLYVVHGRLDVAASGEPVRFTSAEATPAPGDWRGIVVHQPTWGMAIDGDFGSYAAAVRLDHAIIEYAGADACPAIDANGRKGCTRCSRGAFTVALGNLLWQSIHDVTFRHDRDAHVDTTCERGAFKRFDENRFEGGPVPLRVRYGTAPSLGGAAATVVLEPDLGSELVALPKGDYRIERSIDARELALVEGSTVRLAPGVRLAADKLVASGVTFTWTGTAPWAGLSLLRQDSSIDGCTFEHGGAIGTAALIDLSRAKVLHHVWDNTFRDNLAPAFAVAPDLCAELRAQHNVSATAALCAK